MHLQGGAEPVTNEVITPISRVATQLLVPIYMAIHKGYKL